ncbi:hypothetical protein A2U01_0065102, partial [Trifolium medium]|nr:hypothetical protein [Trifolium medium]
ELEEVASTKDAGVGPSNANSDAQVDEDHEADMQGEDSDESHSI